MPINFRNEGGASLHPSGDRFIAGGSDLWVRVFDYQSGEQMECLKVRTKESPDKGNSTGSYHTTAVLKYVDLYGERLTWFRAGCFDDRSDLAHASILGATVGPHGHTLVQ